MNIEQCFTSIPADVIRKHVIDDFRNIKPNNLMCELRLMNDQLNRRINEMNYRLEQLEQFVKSHAETA